MTWWTNQSIQAKTKSNFLLMIGGQAVYNVKTVKKPSATVETQEYKLLNHFYKYPGVVKWDPVEVTLANVKVPGGGEGWKDTKALWDMLRKSGYRPPTEEVEAYPNTPYVTTPEKASFMSRTFADSVVKLAHLDKDTGDIMELWQLHNPIISKVDWGDYAYGEAEFVQLSFTIEYDYAVYKDANQIKKDGDTTTVSLN